MSLRHHHTEKYSSQSRLAHPEEARAIQAEVDEARFSLLETSDKIRQREDLKPTKALMRELADKAFLLAEANHTEPMQTASILAETVGNLHAVSADRTLEGRRIARLFNSALKTALQTPNKLHRELEAEALVEAIKNTSPDHSFDAALEEAWQETIEREGWNPVQVQHDGVNYTRLVPPPPKESLLSPSSTGWRRLIKKITR